MLPADLLKKYLIEGKTGPFYDDAKKEAFDMSIHADGEYPASYIEMRRPSESEYIQNYRKTIFQPITQEVMNAVWLALSKVRKADGWVITYPEKETGMADDERPSVYFQEGIPVFGDIQNWLFGISLRFHLTDANGVFVVKPYERVTDASSYAKPYPFPYRAEQVVDYIPGEYIVLKDHDDGDMNSETFITIDRTEWILYRKDTNGKFQAADTWNHGLGYLPIISCRGMYKKQKGTRYLFTSRLSAMLPRLNEAIREYSDLQAEVVQHIHSEKWVYANQSCPTCKGIGKVRQGQPVELVTCSQCNGTGEVLTSPYSSMHVKPPKVGEQPVPIPPAGYITKDTNIVEVQDKRIDKHMYRALCAVNMQFIDAIPIAESGIAKAQDADAMNTTVNNIVEDLARIAKEFCRIAIDLRYSLIVQSEEARKLLMPTFHVPKEYNFLMARSIVEEIKAMKDGNVNPAIVVAKEKKLAEREFSSEPLTRDELNLSFELDPFAGIGADDKEMMLSGGTALDLDVVLSNYIHVFIREQMVETNGTFIKKSRKAQLTILTEMAQAKLDAIAEGKKFEVPANPFDPANPAPPAEPVPPVPPDPNDPEPPEE